MTRIIGPRPSPRRRYALLSALLGAMLAAGFVVGAGQATVNDNGTVDVQVTDRTGAQVDKQTNNGAFVSYFGDQNTNVCLLRRHADLARCHFILGGREVRARRPRERGIEMVFGHLEERHRRPQEPLHPGRRVDGGGMVAREVARLQLADPVKALGKCQKRIS